MFFFKNFYFILQYSWLTMLLVSGVWNIRWRRKWQPTPIFLPGKSHGEAWRATVHGVAKSQTCLRDWAQNIEHSSLYYTVGPCWLSILNSSVYMSIPNSLTTAPHQPFPLSNHKFILCLWVCLCLKQGGSHMENKQST